MLQKLREEYFVAYKFIDPIGAHYTRNSHVFEAIRKACTDWICMGAILRRLSHYAFGTPGNSYFVTSMEILRCLSGSVWSTDYIRDAEKFASLSVVPGEIKQGMFGKLRTITSILVSRKPLCHHRHERSFFKEI